ncbi:MAG: isoaspartyl peptidase/L-asparaginase family protein [Pirellulaceae bacterium]
MRGFRFLMLLAFASGFAEPCSPFALAQDSGEKAKPTFSIVIHGGAGGNPDKWSEEYKQQRRDGLNAALNLGVEMLQGGSKSLDVVEAVIRELEDDATFNAGRGCVLNEQGRHELDASIMDGRTLGCGAVASVRTIRHPISLARRVMLDTKHVLLSGDGAEKFGVSLGLETAEDEHFQTDQRKQQWKIWKQRQATKLSTTEKSEAYFGTVGCVVVDSSGNLAAGTSTGGLMGKRWGRVGDSPIIGAGNYADNGTCAVSGTGVGEEFIRHNIAADVAARMRYGGKELAEAAQAAIASLPENCGGIIAVDQAGNMVMEFNTVAMSRAFANSDGDRGVLLASEPVAAPQPN